MKIKLVIICIILFLIGCSTSQKELKETQLIEAVIKCIDSGEFPGKIMGVYQKRDYYDGYNLYFIGRFYGIVVGEDYPYKISKIKDKYVFFFSYNHESLPEDEADKLIDEIGEYEGEAVPTFYFAQCKKTGVNLLSRAVNDYIEPYEIPEIREFRCSGEVIKKENIEIIVNKFNVDFVRALSLNSDTANYSPTNYSAVLAVYNRSDSCLFFGDPKDSLGYFGLVNGKDTLYLHTKLTHRYNYFNDDPLHIRDPERLSQFIINSDNDPNFFSDITTQNYHDNLLRLMRDSLFYFPDKARYSQHADSSCIFPAEKVKVIVPIEAIYSYSTPEYTYNYINDVMFLKEKR